jgi:hypothetical protein
MAPGPPKASGGRADLLSAIGAGVKLKKAAPAAPAGEEGGADGAAGAPKKEAANVNDALLAAIRGGAKLKKASERKVVPSAAVVAKTGGDASGGKGGGMSMGGLGMMMNVAAMAAQRAKLRVAASATMPAPVKK